MDRMWLEKKTDFGRKLVGHYEFNSKGNLLQLTI